MAEIRSNPVMEIEVSTPVGFQPEFVDDASTEEVIDETAPLVEEKEEVSSTESEDDTGGNAYMQNAPDYDEEEEEEEEEEISPLPTAKETVEDDSRSKASILAESFKEIGGLPEDYEVSNDLTGYDLLVSLDKSREASALEKVRAEFSERYSEESLQYVDFLRRGGDPKLISDTSNLSNLNIDGFGDEAVANRKSIIIAMYKDKGLGDKHAQRLYEDFADEGEDVAIAQEGLTHFRGKRDIETKAAQTAEDARKAEESASLEQVNDKIRTTIRGKKLGEVELSTEQASSLEKYMFEPTQLIDINQGGTTKKARVSQYYKDYSEFFGDTNNLIKLARFIQSGGNQTVEEEEVERKVNQKLVDRLNNPEKGARSRKRKPKRNAWLDREEGLVAEFDY